MPSLPPVFRPGGRARPTSNWKPDAERGSRHERGYGHKWVKIREAVLKDEPLCRLCAQGGRTRAAKTVDHIVAKARGGGDERANLQPLCWPCHKSKTAREKGEGGIKSSRQTP